MTTTKPMWLRRLHAKTHHRPAVGCAQCREDLKRYGTSCAFCRHELAHGLEGETCYRTADTGKYFCQASDDALHHLPCGHFEPKDGCEVCAGVTS